MADTSQWTSDLLKEHIIAVINANDVKYTGLFDESKNAVREAFLAQQTAMQTALTAQKLAVDTAQLAADRAVAKAETAADKRFDSVNEFRALVNDQQRLFMPRSEAELLFKAMTEKIDALSQNVTTLTAQKSGMKDIWAYLMGGVGILSLVASVIFNIIK